MARRRSRKTPVASVADAQPQLKHRFVWDRPTRLSHWALAVLLPVQFVTGLTGLLPKIVHLWCGYVLLTVLLFRLLWGLFGSDSARFARFLRGPKATFAYLRQLPEPRPSYWPGHNPIGAWSVLILLGLTLAQSLSGLFARQYRGIAGPLADTVSRDLARALSDPHDWLYWLLLLWILVHIGAALYHLRHKRENLIRPIFGDGRLPLPNEPDLHFAGMGRAWLLLAVSAALVAAIVLV